VSQPPVWTFLEFEADDDAADVLADGDVVRAGISLVGQGSEAGSPKGAK
jgi:hypothetical protein